jgi:hypothetical protein
MIAVAEEVKSDGAKRTGPTLCTQVALLQDCELPIDSMTTALRTRQRGAACPRAALRVLQSRLCL